MKFIYKKYMKTNEDWSESWIRFVRILMGIQQEKGI